MSEGIRLVAESLTPPPGTPWWGWLLGLVAVSAIPALATWLASGGLRRDAKKAATELTPNHGGSSKDQLTQLISAQTRNDEALRSIQSEQRATRRDIGGLREEIRVERDERRIADQQAVDKIADLEDTITRPPRL